MASVSSADSSPGALVAAGVTETVAVPQDTTPVTEKSTHALVPLRNGTDFFGPVGHKHTANLLDLAIVKLFCAGGIAPQNVDLPEWKEIFRILIPRYVPASRTRLMDNHIMSEQERVRVIQLADLQTQHYLTLTFDGGVLRSGEYFFSFHATTSDDRVMLLELRECSRVSHTAEFISKAALEVKSLVYSITIVPQLKYSVNR